MPWDPVRDLLTMQERLECLFGQATGWVPPVDLCELPDRYVISVELPGLAREDVRIDVQDDTITLGGQRPARHETACPERYQQLERGQGAFSRSFRFTQPIQVNAVSADLVDGVLTVSVPKVSVSVRVDVA